MGRSPAASPCGPPLPAPSATLSLELQGQAAEVARDHHAAGHVLSLPSSSPIIVHRWASAGPASSKRLTHEIEYPPDGTLRLSHRPSQTPFPGRDAGSPPAPLSFASEFPGGCLPCSPSVTSPIPHLYWPPPCPLVPSSERL